MKGYIRTDRMHVLSGNSTNGMWIPAQPSTPPPLCSPSRRAPGRARRAQSALTLTLPPEEQSNASFAHQHLNRAFSASVLYNRRVVWHNANLVQIRSRVCSATIHAAPPPSPLPLQRLCLITRVFFFLFLRALFLFATAVSVK